MTSRRTRAHWRPGLVLLLALSALAPMAAAGAQEPTTTTSTTSTTVPPPPTTAAPAPTTPPTTAAPTPTEPAPAPGPAPAPTPPPPADAAPEAAPPPLAAPLPPPPPPSPRDAALDQALFRLTNSQRKAITTTKARIDESAARLATLQLDLDQTTARLAEARLQRDRAAKQFADSKRVLKDRAVAAYTGERLSLVSALLEARDLSELSRRSEMIDSVVRADKKAMEGFREDRDVLEATTQELHAATEVQRAAVQQEQDLQATLSVQLEDLRKQMTVVRGLRLSLGDFVFPVEPPYAYGDSWGAPRMMGTEYQHYHQGIDIMAAAGTPLRACVRGQVTKVGTDVLGGIKLWIVGEDGTAYYYAHLSRYEEGMQEGMVVEPGQVVGYVGDTGNARGGLPHLHFEIHPGGGDAINPYPVLKAVDDAEQAALASGNPRPQPTAPVLPG